jgi:FkbM family methyltransferase
MPYRTVPSVKRPVDPAPLITRQPPPNRPAVRTAFAEKLAHDGPGTELKRLLSWFGLHESPGCNCQGRADLMNAWGPDRCRREIPTITEWLQEAAWAARMPFNATLVQPIILTAIGLAAIKQRPPVGLKLDDHIEEVDYATLSDEVRFSREYAAAQRNALAAVVVSKHEYPGNQFAGRGIVIPGGGVRYFPCAFAALAALRSAGCALPVEIWHLPGEIEPGMRQAVAWMPDVCFRDAGELPRPRILNGWELKPFAIINSRFSEVLLLDADNLVSRDPTTLFESPGYAAHGAVFWPDIGNGKLVVSDEAWDRAGVDADNRALHSFESGQILVDKSRCWHELAVAMHINAHSDYWYNFVYGDKDTFKLAWHRCRRQYGFAPPCGWLAPAIVQHDESQNRMFYHCCQGKAEIISGQCARGMPVTVAAAVRSAAETLRKYWHPDRHRMYESRATLEAVSRDAAVNLPLPDDRTLTRVAASVSLFARTSESCFTHSLIEVGLWESWITRFLRGRLPAGSTFVDVGGHIGYYTVLAASWGCRVVYVEPDPVNVALCADSLRLNGLEAELHECAAWDRQTGLRLEGESHRNMNAVVVEDPHGTIAGVPLDSMLADYPRVDLIKMDCEGAESRVWEGMRNIIARTRARVLVEFEAHRNHPRQWVDELCRDYRLRVVGFDGELRDVSRGELEQSPPCTMLYLSRVD